MMPKHVYNCTGTKLLCVIDARPESGDFCDRCGADLYNSGEMCTNGGDHLWAVDDCGKMFESEIQEDQSEVR